MATVFLARDIRNERPVAIKVLHEDLAMALGGERFKREIHIATSLSHPHILQLFDSGEADGQLYYVMPYIEGESLRARIDREKILPIEDALRITSEVASALDFAHRKNIIHRDIKPENILLQEGHAVVADFGIARAVNSMNDQASLTQTGMSVGTPTYMSPEQAFADKSIDGRSDEYSLACVLYEMLTGQPPFTGPNAQAIMARHSMGAVPSMQIVRNTIPDEVEDLVQRALAKAPADRFPTLGEFAQELQECVIDHATVTRRVDRRTLARPVPRAAKQSNRKYIITAAAGALILLGGFGAWKFFGRSAAAASPGSGGFEPSRVAVMYFDDVSPNRQLAYMADGLTESLIDQLTDVKELDVVSKSGVGRFRGSEFNFDSVANALNAGTLVRGTVSEEGDRVNVSIRLVDGNSGADVGRKGFELPKREVLAVRDSIAAEIASYLRPFVGEEIRLRETKRGTTNVAAWTLVQRAEKLRKDGEAQAAKRDVASSRVSFSRADSLLTQAESLDRDWLEPLTKKGAVALSRVRASADPVEAQPVIEHGLSEGRRALAREPRNADALEVVGILLNQKWSLSLASSPREADRLLDSAQASLERAVAIAPSKAQAWSALSEVYQQKGKMPEAKIAARQAYEADAFLSGTEGILWRLFVTSYDANEFPDAVKYCNEGARRFPNHTLTRCKLMLFTMKASQPDVAAAEREYARLKAITPPRDWELLGRRASMVVAATVARAGNPDSARKLLIAARPDSRVDPQGALAGFEAFMWTLLGTARDTTEAIDVLTRFLSTNPQHRRGYATSKSWWWEGLKNDPRFINLVGSGK